MRVLVTGTRGKVGAQAVKALLAAGHEVTATDRGPAVFERPEPGEATYQQADLGDAGSCWALVHGHDVVVHVAAIPEPTAHPAHVVFGNNLMATFQLLEAAVRLGVKRFVNISSETVPGFFFAEREFLPDYVPVDEQHPIRPQDPYALSKHFGEQLCDAAVRRSDLRCTTLRPSWVQTAENYERNLGPQVRDASVLSPGFWSYIDNEDLADAIVLAAETDLPGHEVFYIASPDNAGSHDFAEVVRRYYGDRVELRPVARVDASGIDCAKAHRLLGWAPTRSWRDHLDAEGRAR